MTRRENLNAPSLDGAIIAAGLALVAFAVAKVVGGFDYTPAGFFAALVFVGAAVFLVLPWGDAFAKAAAPSANAEPAPVVAPVGSAAAAPAMAEGGAGSKPAALTAPRDGKGDDLQKLEGIGPALEKLCHELGIFHFDQIASWGAAEVAWMDSNLKGFKGRVTRDKWVAQAKLIGEVGMEEFLRRAKTNDY